MVDIEGGGASAQCVSVDAEAMDFGREGELAEGGKETCFSEGGFDENTVKIPVWVFPREIILRCILK